MAWATLAPIPTVKKAPKLAKATAFINLAFIIISCIIDCTNFSCKKYICSIGIFHEQKMNQLS
ncbi:hypothetical protein F340043K4_01710 [Veillonella parvula]